MNEKNQTDSFFNLDPELVLEATESAGFQTTGEFTQLNSYENRVFDIRLESNDPARVIAKFYRPNRWTKEAILEEHHFLDELLAEGLTVAPALKQKNTPKNSPTLSTHRGMNVAYFAKVQGRMPQELTFDDLQHVGKKLAILHNVGSRTVFKHRPLLGESPHDPWSNLDFLLPWISPEHRSRYERVASDLLSDLQDAIDPDSFQAIHGDCHRGNILHNGKVGNDSEFFFVDFDDSMSGPVVQDIWMLLSGTDSGSESMEEKEALLQGYESLRSFPREQLEWIPLLRGLRIVSYAAWIARRWEDPSFPRLFPQFKDYNYWAEEVEALERILWSY